jgi:pimeloyl-ACP methyl ester carboxylesterase
MSVPKTPGGRRRLLGKLASGLGGAVDGAVLSALRYRFSQASPSRQQGAVARAAEHQADRRALLLQAIEFYDRPEVRAGFFPEPPAPRVAEATRRRLPGGRVVDVAFPSAYQPAWDLARRDYLQHEPNLTARARLYLHASPAPTTLVCLHGFRGGAFFIEERAFPVRWLYSLGLDVVLFQLPFHGDRAGRHAPVWPSSNPIRTNEGFGHAIFDLRALIKWLRTRDGAGQAMAAAVCGMSLGGYTAALWATVEPLAFVAPMIPVASFPDLMWSHGEGSRERERAEREGIDVEMLRRVMAVHTPILRTPRVPPERVQVIAAKGDRIAPGEQAERLAAHFRSEVLRFTGGHILQFGRGDALRALARRMGTLGLLPPKGP